MYIAFRCGCSKDPDWWRHQGRILTLYLLVTGSATLDPIQSQETRTWLSHTPSSDWSCVPTRFCTKNSSTSRPQLLRAFKSPETKTQEPRSWLPQRCVTGSVTKPKTSGWEGTGGAIYHLGWGQLAWEDPRWVILYQLHKSFFLLSNVAAGCLAIKHLQFGVPKISIMEEQTSFWG